ncbi:DUF1877 family protein [Promicromonospora sp. NPDC019610]|uniref:DUF1877 family protein n=1 Tax=Promicromonospora sp. NPDC019610 TaxID=3364405 RepID=UPI0037987FD4
MSMIGEYMRLAPHDLGLTLADPESTRDLIDELWDLEDEGADPDARLMDVDKAWHGLAFVLERAGVSTAAVHGDAQVPGADDWGYGPPSWLSVERVAELSAALRGLDVDAVVGAVPAAVLVAAEVYPLGLWAADSDWQGYLAGHLKRLTDFFAEAADAGMGVLVWID